MTQINGKRPTGLSRKAGFAFYTKHIVTLSVIVKNKDHFQSKNDINPCSLRYQGDAAMLLQTPQPHPSIHSMIDRTILFIFSEILNSPQSTRSPHLALV